MKDYLTAILWIPVIVVKLVLAILGLVLVPLGIALDWPKPLWIWGNDEEGCPDWWLRRAKGENIVARTFPCWWWYAIRNPVNNMRFLVWDKGAYHERSNWPQDIKMEAPQMIERNQPMAFRWRRRGWMSGYRKVWLHGFEPEIASDHVPAYAESYSELWIGWKIGSGVPGLGFAIQLRIKRPVGQ